MTAPFRLTPPIPLEDDLHLSVYQALHVLLPSDAVLNTWELKNARNVREGRRRKARGALPGWPDMGVFWRNKVALLELKRFRLGTVSKAQRELHPKLAAAGFPVAVCRDVEEALVAVHRAGIPIRGRVGA